MYLTRLIPVVFIAAMIVPPRLGFALTHIARRGETLQQLAVQYYGDPELTMVIRAANGFVHPDDGSLTEGERVEIPEVTYYRMTEDDTFESIAEEFLASAKRARFLAKMNDMELGSSPPPGTIIKIPYHLRHIFAANESLRSVTRLYYGKKRSTRWVRLYNLTKKKRFARGDVLIIPLLDLSLTSEEQAKLEKKRARIVSEEDIDSQENALSQIAAIRKAYEKGAYVEAVAIAQRLLGRGTLTAPQQIGVQNYLGFSYVALGERQLALEAFVKSLRLQPAMELSPITTSPKILEVFRKARDKTLSASATESTKAAPAAEKKPSEQKK